MLIRCIASIISSDTFSRLVEDMLNDHQVIPAGLPIFSSKVEPSTSAHWAEIDLQLGRLVPYSKPQTVDGNCKYVQILNAENDACASFRLLNTCHSTHHGRIKIGQAYQAIRPHARLGIQAAPLFYSKVTIEDDIQTNLHNVSRRAYTNSNMRYRCSLPCARSGTKGNSRPSREREPQQE